MQVIDFSTCKPLHGAQVDLWHANAIGDYSTKMDGYLRGWQPTSYQGTVDFDTNFPGHYNARASHMHVVVRYGSDHRAYSNGQIYFEQKLRDAVEVISIISISNFETNVHRKPSVTRTTSRSSSATMKTLSSHMSHRASMIRLSVGRGLEAVLRVRSLVYVMT